MTTLMTLVMKWLGYIQPSYLPLPELVKFAFFANLSIVGMNVSLMWNSVGFYQVRTETLVFYLIEDRSFGILQVYWSEMYIHCVSCLFFQIAKLCIIPVLCILEIIFDKVRYSRDTKLSIVLVLVGVAVCTVTDVSVNSQGLLAAVIAVWSTALQQHVSIVDIKTCPLLFIYLYMTPFPNWSYPSLAPIFIAWLLF
jgi:hypothetical protein